MASTYLKFLASGTASGGSNVNIFDSAGNSLTSTAGSLNTNVTGGSITISGTSSTNVAQFGGNNVVTGTGASGVGIPRVTVSNDSNILATQSGSWSVTATQATAANLNATVVGTGTFAVQASQSGAPWSQNVTQFGSNNVVTGTGASGIGIPRVTVSNDSNVLATQSGTWNITNISGTISLPTGAATSANQTNGSQLTGLVAGSAIVGKVGIDQTTPGTTNNVTLSGVGNSLTPQFAVGVLPTGLIKAGKDPNQLFDDTFFGNVIDTTNRWNSPVSAGGGVAAVQTSGQIALGTGTTANGYSYIQSQNNFQQLAPGWLELFHAVNLEFPVLTNGYRFWGFGTVPATPTAAAPLTDAIGFEVATTGKMFAVTYSGGVRNVIQDLSTGSGNSTQPQDANVHKYFLFFRGDVAYWCIDTFSNLVATMATGAPGPLNNTLPITLLAVANSTPPGSSIVLTDNACFVGDTTGASAQISDGMFAWRKATVKMGNVASVAADTSLVVGISPNSNSVMANVSPGFSNAQVYNTYSTTNITTAAYTQLVASTSNATTYLDIFDSSGQTMILATGAPGSEVNQFYVPPGGDQISLKIPAGTRVAYKALTANATTGYLVINLMQ